MALEYTIPEIPLLLTLASFLFFLNVAGELASAALSAGIIGPIVIGIVYGPEAANIVPTSAQDTFLVLGYIGLLFIVFEAGLTTDMVVLYNNVLLSIVAALVGIGLPIGLSMLLLCVGFKYTALQSFAAGAALCSTSLGTTLSLLTPEMQQTRTGVVILSAALFDDIVGLVVASVIGEISFTSGSIGWQAIVRPILVSFAFIFVSYIAARFIPPLRHQWLQSKRVLLFCMVFVLAGYVAGAQYAGTSELLGAYLAGALLRHVFPDADTVPSASTNIDKIDVEAEQASNTVLLLATPVSVFAEYLSPTLTTILSPLFFASIGASLPMSSLGSANGSHQVVWRGIVYSVLMFVGKAAVGLTILVWPDRESASGRGWFGCSLDSCSSPGLDGVSDPELKVKTTITTRTGTSMRPVPSAVLLGLAMVARGEIALIVAQLGRPILEEDPEVFAVVIWAILVNTVGGAVGVGVLLRGWRTRTQSI